MTERRCPSCGCSVRPGFLFCPNCSASLTGAPTVSLVGPVAQSAPAERQGRGDLTIAGFGIVVLGIIGFLGAVMSVFGGHGGANADTAVTVGGGAILLVLAGSIIAGFGISGRRGAAAGLAGGCASVAVGLGLGALLFLAALGFLFVSCLATLSHH